MKYLIQFALYFVFISTFAVSWVFAQSQTSNSISGFVLDETNRNPVSDVYVELLNELYTTLRRVKTDGSGRYFFAGMSSGNFKVKVMPYGTNYLAEERDITITNYRVGNTVTSDSVYLDLYLKPDRRKTSIFEIKSTGAIFVQEVPASARDLYKKSISQFENVRQAESGFENLKKALEVFPDYYDALDKLGTEFVKRKQYFEAIPFLVRSITVNQRSFSSFYMLGLAAYNLKQMNDAENAFRAATVINPQSIPANLQYGMILRINGNYKEAEKILLKADSLDKSSLVGVIHWQLALLYDKLERFDEAANELEKYLKIEPEVENVQQIKSLIKQMRSKAKK